MIRRSWSTRRSSPSYDPSANPDDGLYLYGMSLAQLFQRTIECMDNVCRDSIMAAAKDFEWDGPAPADPRHRHQDRRG